MATVSFLWHLHQPGYRTADGVSHAPWAALHAGGTYTTLARAIETAGGRGQVLNIVPTLLEQLLAYQDGTVEDPVVEAILTPAGELTAEQCGILISWAFHVNPRQLNRYSRLADLASRRPATINTERLESLYGRGDLRDLQILFVLAQAGEQAWSDPRLKPLFERGSNFANEHHRQLCEWLRAQPGELEALWRRVGSLDGVEISTSPFAHPIMPLLIDTAVVAESWAPHPAPVVPDFRYPEDAAWQLERGLAYLRDRGFQIHGCWPPEGSVSSDALTTYADAGIRWLVTDEGILERSLGRPLRNGGPATAELYRPWLKDDEGPVLFFRDRRLSDAIGFEYGRWEDEKQAARAFVSELEQLGRDLPDDACITIALDGENPWLYYPEGGGPFLRELFQRLNGEPSGLRPVTFDAALEHSPPSRLDRLHPGSWINSIFATWIGHHEKTRAWQVLAEVRNELAAAGGDRPPSLLLAEGSDWFWWLGDDNPTALAPLYDRIFRKHLADACDQAGIESPVDLLKPLKTATRFIRVPVSSAWERPRLDGAITSYWEWCRATWIEAKEPGPLGRLAVWGDPELLHVLVESAGSMQALLETGDLVVKLVTAAGDVTEIELGAGHDDLAPSTGAVGRVAEFSLPWDGLPGSRLEVHLGASQLPEGAALLLDPYPVDLEYRRERRKD
jgi:alpha-amylase/alpha-mannosidase (GH57 family)